MRPALICGGLAGILLITLPAHAQTSDVRTVIVREVLVRSGPSDKFYATSRLSQGDRVVVVPAPPDAQQPGWVAIRPPRGSFSWINQRFVEVIATGTGKVVADNPVPVLVGSSENNEHSKEGTKAARGAQVIILDRPNYTDEGVWLPILPHTGEVRYIPESAVQPISSGPAVAAYTNPPAPRPSGAPGNPVVAPTLTVGTPSTDDVARNLQKAADAETDPVRRAQILQMIASLPQRPAAGGVMPAAAAAPTTAAPGNTALYRTGAAAGASTAKWSSYGTLRRTGYREADGRPVYALEDDAGHTLVYAAPLPNLTLEPYLGHRLTLYGPVFYNPVIRLDEVTVSHVYEAKQQQRSYQY
jgi:hypothetical protein